jgi:hypothetical protein
LPFAASIHRHGTGAAASIARDSRFSEEKLFGCLRMFSVISISFFISQPIPLRRL